MRSQKRQEEFDTAYMKMADAVSQLSYARRLKVGSIIVSKDDQVISQGFNGTPAGFSNVCEEIQETDGIMTNLDDNPVEFNNRVMAIQEGSDSAKLVTKKMVLHAEANAITKCAKFNNSSNGGILYVTHSPCIDCAKMIVQAGIRKVVYGTVYKNTDGLDFLNSCGIETQLHEIKKQ